MVGRADTWSRRLPPPIVQKLCLAQKSKHRLPHVERNTRLLRLRGTRHQTVEEANNFVSPSIFHAPILAWRRSINLCPRSARRSAALTVTRRSRLPDRRRRVSRATSVVARSARRDSSAPSGTFAVCQMEGSILELLEQHGVLTHDRSGWCSCAAAGARRRRYVGGSAVEAGSGSAAPCSRK